MPASRASTTFMKNSSRTRGPGVARLQPLGQYPEARLRHLKYVLRGPSGLLDLVAVHQAVPLQALERAVNLADVHRRPDGVEAPLEALFELVAVSGAGREQGEERVFHD